MAEVSFAEVEQEFMDRISSTVWCTLATIDRQGRPRSRILHPIWEGGSDGGGPTGWILTGRNTLKAKHIAKNPYVSITYWDPNHKQVYADCKAEWIDEVGEKKRIWDLYKSTPPPLGYDPGLFFPGVDNPDVGLMKLAPWRIELFSLEALASGQGAPVWHA